MSAAVLLPSPNAARFDGNVLTAPAKIGSAPVARKGTPDHIARLWGYVARRYVEGASLGLIASETGMNRSQVAHIVRKHGLQGAKRQPSETLPYQPPRSIKQMMEDRRASAPAPARSAEAIAKDYWSSVRLTKRYSKIIPAWVPDELEAEYRWWVTHDSEEAAASWAREAKRTMAGAV
jgi:hypothetical protein